MTEREKLHNEMLYLPDDPEIMREQLCCLEKLYDFNATRPTELEKRDALLREMFAELGEDCYVEPPLYANWGGKHVHFGDRVYANFHLTLVDDTHIYVGSNTMFAPNVTVATANHPIDAELRSRGLQYNRDVVIGENAWIGAGVIIVPGVRIGKNSVIGAGSIVTKDVPENVVAVGNPCRVLREIGERDKEFFYKNERIDWEEPG